MSKPDDDYNVKLDSALKFVRSYWVLLVAVGVFVFAVHDVRRDVAACEARVAKLETDKSDRATLADLAHSLEKVATAVERDHDVVVRLVTLAEQQSKQRSP